MARPKKYDWESIEKAYRNGVNVDVISKKYKVAKKTLQNKASELKWDKVSGSLNNDIDEFKEVLGKVTGHAQNDPIMQDIIVDKINTIIADNEIIENNRKLAKAFQGLMASKIRSGEYKTPQDIKAGASTIKDLEAVSNPQRDTQNISVNTNTVQQTTITKTEIKEALVEFENEY